MRLQILVIALLLIAASTAYAALPTILVSKIDPQPVEPGKDFTIDVTLFNRQTDDTGEFSVVLDAPFPVLLRSASEDLSKINLCGGCKKDFKYFLSVDPKGTSGSYALFIKAASAGSEIKQRADIKVQGKPNLVFFADSEALGNVTPNQKFSVEIAVTNIGTGQARQIKIQPESSSFVVIGSSLRTIEELNASGTKSVSFDFVASSSLEANSYLIPFRFAYFDEQGSSINASQNLGVRVVNKGGISVQTIKVVSNTGSTAIASGQPFTAVVRIENTGPGDADTVSADLSCPFTERKRSFIGQLKKDEDAPAVFDLTARQPGNYECSLLISYSDDTGSHQIAESFSVSVGGGISIVGIIIALLIVALIYFFRKRIMAPFARKQ